MKFKATLRWHRSEDGLAEYAPSLSSKSVDILSKDDRGFVCHGRGDTKPDERYQTAELAKAANDAEWSEIIAEVFDITPA